MTWAGREEGSMGSDLRVVCGCALVYRRGFVREMLRRLWQSLCDGCNSSPVASVEDAEAGDRDVQGVDRLMGDGCRLLIKT